MNRNKKYKICHLFYEQYPRDPRVRRYVNALNEEGKSCVIICSKKKHEHYFEKLNGNLIYRIPISKKRSSFYITFFEYIVFTFISANLLIYLGLKFRFSIVHVHTLPDFLVFATFWNKVFGTNIILDMHEIFPELYMARTGSSENSFRVKLLKTVEKKSLKFADYVITIHDNAKEIFVSRNPDIKNKINIVMNSVDPAEFMKKKYNEANIFNITYNGSIVKLLNLTMIVEALATLKTDMPSQDFSKIRFKIYGDGPALNEILALAEKTGLEATVKNMGYVQPDEMRKQFLITSVVILPPLKNIYSDQFYTIKLIEAVYLKIPVIATRLNTYLRYYSEDSLFYFDSGNLNELIERIKEVFYNKELVRKKTEVALKEYEKVGWEVMKSRYSNIIKSLMIT